MHCYRIGSKVGYLQAYDIIFLCFDVEFANSAPKPFHIAEKISAMIEKYRKEIIDIEDVEFEDVDLDLEFDALFPDNEVESPKADKSGNEYYDKIS